jgi:hypothetical protein
MNALEESSKSRFAAQSRENGLDHDRRHDVGTDLGRPL